MPPAIGLAIAGIAAGLGALGSAKIGSNAAKRAGTLEADAAAQQLAYLKAKDEQEQRNWETTQAENRRMFDATEAKNYSQWAFREGHLAPYRAIGSGATSTLANLMGVPYTPERFAPPAYQGASAAAPATTTDPKVAAFIQNWQGSHPPTEGIAPLAAAIAQQFPHVSRYMYGQTPSDNELNIGGEKFKVLGGEKTPGAYWYTPGTDDRGAAAATPGLKARYAGGTPLAPFTLRDLMAQTPTLAAAPPRQALTFRDLMAAYS